MKYTLPSQNYARTSDYQGTTDDYKNDPDVLALKKSVALHNAEVRKNSRERGKVCGVLGRVRVKPRGPRKSSIYHTLVQEATHYDVYAGEDTEAMRVLEREITTGLSLKYQRIYDDAKYKIRVLDRVGEINRNGGDSSCWDFTLKSFK